MILLAHKGCGCCAGVLKSEDTLFCEPVSETAFAQKLAQRYSASILRTLGQKADDEEEKLGESGGEEWRDDELALAALLAAWAYARMSKHRQGLVDLFNTVNASRVRIDDALEAMARDMAQAFTPNERDAIHQTISRLINKGAIQIPGATKSTIPALVPGANTVIEGFPTVGVAADFLTDITLQAVQGYADRFVLPYINRRLQQVVDATGPLDALDYSGLVDALDSRLTTTAYWDLVANSSSARAYHYGYLKAASVQRFTLYQWVSVLDERTTVFCRSMNGRRFSVMAGLNLMETAFASGTVQGLIDTMPWVDADESADDVTDAEMTAGGIILPPAHAGCRSTIRVV